MQEFDPLGIGSYMRSRMRELIGTDVLGAEPFEVPRFALNEPSQLIEEMPVVGDELARESMRFPKHLSQRQTMAWARCQRNEIYSY